MLKKRFPKSYLFLYKIAPSKAIATGNNGWLSSNALKMNELITSFCPNHNGYNTQTAGTSEYLNGIVSRCYCHPLRSAGNFSELVELETKHFKSNRSFFRAFRYTTTPYGLKPTTLIPDLWS